jgi:HK97 gp10 family phage protein
MIAAEIVVEFNYFPGIAAALEGKVADCVQKAVRDVEAQAKARAAVDTGAMKSSITGRMTGRFSGEVAPHVEYAIFVEYGTRAHVITAKNAGALYWPGAAHPVKSVNHPGTAAQPFMRPAAEAVRGPFTSCIRQAVESAGR